MVVDYEAAFVALGEFIASKPQHGRSDLLTRMAELSAENRVPAGELSRLLRLYGVEVERVREMSTESPATAADFGPGFASGPDGDRAPAIIDRGGHDGSSGDAGRAQDGDGDGGAGGRRRAAVAGG